MSSDEVVTYDDAARWLPEDVQRTLLLAMTPEQRGWYTEAEASVSEGRFVAVQRLSEREPRYVRTDRP